MLNKESDVITEMFDSIAPTYDAVNRILSFGQDIRWRNHVVSLLARNQNLNVLDVATGTADLLIAIGKKLTQTHAIGIDLSSKMLKVAQEKVNKINLQDRISLKQANACALPFANESFDIVTMGFGIRNVDLVDDAISEFARVLKKHGSLFILEFSLPKNVVVRSFYLWYLRTLLPLVGGMLSKNFIAYRYLNRSVEAFMSPAIFAQTLKRNGFSDVNIIPLTFGIATIYCARKTSWQPS